MSSFEEEPDSGCKCRCLPPCLDPQSFPRCVGCIETASCCRCVGWLGSERPCGVRRHHWLGCATVTALLGCLLILFACAAVSTDASVIRRAAWVKGEDRDTGKKKIYFGLSSVVLYDGSTKVADKRWSDIDCDNEIDGDSCKSCKDGVAAVAPAALIAAATTIPTIATFCQRCSRYGDRNCQKMLGILTGLVGLFTALMALKTFDDDCMRAANKDFDTKPSVGFFAIVAGTALVGLGPLFHACLATPKAAYAAPDTGGDFDETGFRMVPRK